MRYTNPSQEAIHGKPTFGEYSSNCFLILDNDGAGPDFHHVAQLR